MKLKNYLTILVCLISTCLFPSAVSAETSVNISSNDSGSSTNVSVQTNTGNNTICRNGVCTTTSSQNNGTSQVCINGNCTTSEDGNINIESDNGNTKVEINNSSSAPVNPADEKSESKKDTSKNNINSSVNINTDSSISAPVPSISQPKHNEKNNLPRRSLFKQLFENLISIFKSFHL